VTRTILVVEDDDALRQAVVKLLQRQAYVVVSATSAHAAIEVLDRGPVDLILSDYFMADGNGLELLDYVRGQDPAVPPFIMMSGQAGISAAELRAAGLQEFLTKPVSSRNLVDLIARYLVK